MPKFEYKILHTDSSCFYSHEFKDIGEEGWELVCVTAWVQGMGSGSTAYFKRIKNE